MSTASAERARDSAAAERSHPRRSALGRAGADALALACLVALTIMAAWPFLRSGGFFLDDWWLRGEAFYGTDAHRHGFFGMFPGLSHATGFRPVALPYFAIVLTLVGSHAWAAAIVAVTATVALVIVSYAALRVARVRVEDALAVAAVLAVIPWVSSTRFWMSASSTTIAIALVVGGLAMGARTLAAARGRARWAWGIASLLALLAGVLTYEATAGLVGAGILYYLAASRSLGRPQLGKWAADVGVVAIALAIFRTDTQNRRAPTSMWLDHARALLNESAALVRAGAVPDGRWGLAAQVLVAALAVALAGRFVTRRDAVVEAWRAGERRRLAACVACAIGGGLTGLAGYVVMVPAFPWYHPFQPGQGDRVNAVAAVGFAVLYGATAFAFATVLALGLNRAARAAVGLALTALLVGAFVGQTHRQADRYVAAYRIADRTLAGMRAALPRGVRAGDTLLSFDRPANVALGYPALGESWDLNGAVRTLFRTGRVRGFPIVEGQPVVCAGDRVQLPLNAARPPLYGPAFDAPYGAVVFVDAERGSAQRIDSSPECRAALRNFPPGAYFASG